MMNIILISFCKDYISVLRKDPDKHHQPSEKTRHYDQDAVRKFMAKQKAERWKRLHDVSYLHI